MTIVIRKKMILLFAVFLIVIFGFGFFATSTVQTNTVNPLGIVIAIDAGHGGPDGGTVGTKTGVVESDLNLIYAKKLTKYLESFGITVVNTRTTQKGLCEGTEDDFKLVDMKKRIEIINASNAQLLISIHMNKFSSSSENGAQVFFKQNDVESERLANGIKDMLVANFDNARKLALGGDFYILNNSKMPGVIVECGFLSNETEEKLLQQEDYQNKMCYSIYSGIINYLEIINSK